MNDSFGKFYFASLCGLIIFIALLNLLAYQFHWYWEFWWFDMIMHTLGGLWVGSCALWYWFFRKTGNIFPVPQKSFVMAISLAAISVIGVGWEIFEFSVDTFITLSRHDPIDTGSDLFFDIAGATFSTIIFFCVYKKISITKSNT
jgi:hypothetical protein